MIGYRDMSLAVGSVKAMTIEEAKKLLPPELKYPLPDGTIDNLLEIQKIAIDMSEPVEKGMHHALMVALIELKERRERLA